ncbi:MAG: FAD-binding protein, partial [Oligoflexia bacterium]|nr:FAD-binding protein [Oligoflexia bacterium]
DQALAEWPSFTGAEPTDCAVDFLNASAETYDRLSKLGLSFGSPVDGPLMLTPRLQAVDGEGEALVAALAASVPDAVTVRTSTWVQDLVVEDGRVLGVLTADAFIGAQTVVVASGGFASNSEILDTLGASDEDSAWWAAGDSTATGDAITWAQAHDLGIECGECMGWLRNTLPVPDADGEAFFLLGPDVPWIWVDSAGERFVDESHTESITYTAVLQSHQPAWNIAPQDVLLDAISSDDGRAIIQAAIDAGDGFTCAEDDASLAALLAIDADGLAATLANVAQARQDSTIDSVGRDPLTLPVFGRGPICGYQSGRIAAKSFGGLSVDSEGRVLSADGDVIVGLYAVGEAAGMAAPGIGGIAGFDGSLSAVVWSGWRVGATLAR